MPKPWDPRHLAVNPLTHPLRFGKRLISYPIGILNYVRHLHRAEEQDEYRVSVDIAYRYSLVHYHIRVDAQITQLHRAGFTGVEAFGLDCRSIPAQQANTADDPWIYYVCRRAPGTGAFVN